MKLAIVILNYVAYEYTNYCIKSILENEISFETIIVVDNASPNNSCDVLREEFRSDARIKILKTHHNLGFAKGNNIGIVYARKHYDVDYVLLLNSDTLIRDKHYVSNMLAGYEKGVAVIGSAIQLRNGKLQTDETENTTLRGIVYLFLKRLYSYHYFYFPFHTEWGDKTDKTMRLHGCSVLLTPDFFEVYRTLWPYTFLYREEIILAIMLKKAGKTQKIVTNAVIYHDENQSSDYLFDRMSKVREKYELSGLIQELLVKLLPYHIIKKITG